MQLLDKAMEKISLAIMENSVLMNMTPLELINNSDTINFLLRFRSSLYNTLNFPLNKLNLIEMGEYISIGVLLEYMIPLVAPYIEQNPVHPYIFREACFLIMILKIDDNSNVPPSYEKYWTKHPIEHRFFTNLRRRVLDKYVIKEDTRKILETFISN